MVVNIDNKFDEATLAQEKVKIPFVGPDNRKGAKKVGDYVAKQLKPESKVAILEGLPGAFNGIQRKLGFEDALKEAKMDIVTSQARIGKRLRPIKSPLRSSRSTLKSWQFSPATTIWPWEPLRL